MMVNVFCMKYTRGIKVANDLCVGNPSALLEASSSDEVRHALRKNTEEALAMGVGWLWSIVLCRSAHLHSLIQCFGAPWIHVHTAEGKVEPFFGSDRLPLIGHLIGEQFQGPLTHLANASWCVCQLGLHFKQPVRLVESWPQFHCFECWSIVASTQIVNSRFLSSMSFSGNWIHNLQSISYPFACH